MLSLTKLILILAIVFVIFGAGKLPGVMGDLGRGIRNFRDGLGGDKEPEAPAATAKVEVLPPQAEAGAMKSAQETHESKTV